MKPRRQTLRRGPVRQAPKWSHSGSRKLRLALRAHVANRPSLTSERRSLDVLRHRHVGPDLQSCWRAAARDGRAQHRLRLITCLHSLIALPAPSRALESGVPMNSS